MHGAGHTRDTRDPEPVTLASSQDSLRRNCDTSTGLPEIVALPRSEWTRELDYALRVHLLAFREDRIALRFRPDCTYR